MIFHNNFQIKILNQIQFYKKKIILREDFIASNIED